VNDLGFRRAAHSPFPTDANVVIRRKSTHRMSFRRLRIKRLLIGTRRFALTTQSKNAVVKALP
jgi:hypothetical protein